MAELDQEYLNTRKATDTWQAQTLTQLSSEPDVVETPGVTVSPDPNDPDKTITTITEPLPRRTELVGDGDGQVRPGRVTESETVTDQPIASIGGKTPEGRPILKNPDGSISTERSITVTDERINGGKPTNIPSMFGGNQLSEDAAIQRIVEAGGKDPETGRALPGFNTVQEAVDAAVKRSEELGKQNDQSQAQPQGRFTVTDPRINSGQPTPFDSLKDAQAAAGTPDPLAKIEETVGVSPLEGVLKTAEQKDAAKNFVDLLNIPVEHLAGFITKGDVTQTATPDELGAQILAPVADKLKGVLDEKQLGMLTMAVGILGMAVIDPMNPALAAGQVAKATKQLQGKKFKDAVALLKDERGSFQPVPGKGKPEKAVIVFHGSPHSFDKFDIEKIGTGEGAQAFGHGLYFAEDPTIAEGYARKLSPQNPEASNVYHVELQKADVDKMLQWDKPLGEQNETVRKNIQRIRQDLEDQMRLVWEMTSDQIDAAGGALNERDVQAVLKLDDTAIAATFYKALTRALAAGPEATSARLYEYDIPGIQYLDGQSRKAGEGSYNYVLFHDYFATITRKSPAANFNNPYGSSYSTKKQAGASKTPLEPKVSTQVTWEEAIKIDEHQRAFNDGLKTFDERLHKQRGGVQSDVNVFAESIGPDALKMEEFLNLPPGTILKTSDIAAAKRLFTDLTEPARLLAKWLKKNPNDQQAFLALLEQLPQIDVGLTKIAGVFAEPGRLQRMLALDKPVTGMVKADTPERVRISQPYIKQWLDFFQQQQERAAMGAPAMTQEKMVAVLSEMKSQDEILYAAKAISKPGWWDMFTEVWINGLLSGPVTHTTNILSNTATLLWNIPERAVASALSGGAVRPGEAQAMMGGIVESLGDAWALAVKAFKEDESQLGLGKIETPRRAITADALELTGVPGRAVDYLGTVVRLPGRFLMAGDDFFKSIAFRAELRALAKREAFNQINEAGLTGQAAVSKAKEIEAKILANPPESIKDAAQEFAAYTTFTRELGEVGQKVQALAGTPVGRIILPFVRTPTNIFKFAGERTPLALASRAVRDEIAAGGPRRALALAKISLGSMTMGYVATLAANGLITGNGPKDPALRELKKATGWQPNSFKVGDTYVSYSRLEPIGSLFGMAADAADIMGQLDELDAEELASALTVAFARNASSKTFIKGVAETLHAVTSQDVNVVNHYLEKEIPTLIPFSSLLKQTRNVVDPVMREVDTVLEAFKNKVPGFSTDLPPHRNLWGEQVIMEGGLGPDFLSPLYTSSVKDDPVSAEITRLGVPVRKPAKSIDGVPLSPQEYDAYVLLSGGKPILHGMTLKEKLAEVMNGALYVRSSEGPDGGKATLIRQIVSDYRDRAKYILQRPDLSQEYLDKDFPDLRDSLNAAKVQERQKFNAPTTAPGGLTR